MLNIIKLCVGADSIADLEEWIAFRLEEKRRAGEPVEHFHTTRMMPKRRDDLLDGGSLYWVIKGQIQCRQRLTEVRPVVDKEGIPRCQLVLDPQVVPVMPRPRGAFQGWRYLETKDAPPDLGTGGAADMPPELRQELAALGLL